MAEATTEWQGEKIPLQDKEKVFGPAERWYEENKERLQKESPGKHLTLNAADLTHVIGDNYTHAQRLYNAHYGPTPSHGRPMFDIDIPAPPQ